MNYSPILIFSGEPNSVFLEIYFKILKKKKIRSPLILISSEKLLKLQMMKLKFKKNSSVLDFGCGKATTLKNLLKKRNDINPFVFEVSRDYKESWDKWIPENNQATYTIPQKWYNTFDLLINDSSIEIAFIVPRVDTMDSFLHRFAPVIKLYCKTKYLIAIKV